MIYEISDLTFKYPGSDRNVLAHVNLSLDAGQVLCVLGPNGAGKTTLLNCMTKTLSGSGGTIRLCGEDLFALTDRQIAKKVGYVPQIHTPAFNYSVLDFVLMGRSPEIGIFSRPSKEDEDKCMEILESMRLGHLAEKSYLEISGGERQQVLIARALAQEPMVLIFDEPTAHLDYGNQHRVLKRIRRMSEEGYSVIITTHNPDHALLLGDQAAILEKNGQLTQGDCSEIITEERLRKVYEIDLRLVWNEELQRTSCMVPNL